LRNNSIFTFGQVDRAKTSATFREILDAMWLFNDKFERAVSKFNEIKAQQRGDNQQLPTRPTFAKQPSISHALVAKALNLRAVSGRSGEIGTRIVPRECPLRI
jgi:hypothetical protein